MKEEELIKKWLSDELTEEEFKAFKKLDAYSSYLKLSEKAKNFRAPEFDDQKSLNQLETKINSKIKTSKNNIFKYAVAIAAIFVIGFLVINSITLDSDLKSYKTEVAKVKTIELPDQSKVNLSSNSTLSFDANHWDKKRNLKLNGEAYFDVEPGEKFTVSTPYGNIEVLGTEFNIKSRDYSFEVTCYEGSVKVTVGEQAYILEEKQQVVLENKAITQKQIIHSTPDWKRNYTTLKSTPLSNVLEEFKNYYDVKFVTKDINTSRHFTGSFSHNDIQIALKSITLPLDLTYKIKDKKVILAEK